MHMRGSGPPVLGHYNVPVQVANNCLILTNFVVLEMPEDDNMSIILGRSFLNTAGVTPGDFPK